MVKYKPNINSTAIIIVSYFVFALCSISCAKKPPSEQVVVEVNNYTLTTEEFNKLFSDANISGDTKKSRKEFLNNLVIRKLILQEAEHEGLNKKKEFLKSIEEFWEESLLRNVIDKKTLEIYSTITVTEEEIQDAFNKWVDQNPENTKTVDEMRDFIHEQLLRVKQSLAFNAWIQDLKSEAEITIDKKAIGIE